MVVKTQDGVPSRVNAVYTIETYIVELHHLLPFDSTSNVVNEENKKAGVVLISLVSIPRKGERTYLVLDPHTRREGIQCSFP